MKESPFKGSNLEATITNTNNVELLHQLTESAFKKQPESKLWKEAFELIEKRNNRKKIKP
jgi:predicted house-cleaning noncanonical NTP pyrophosphatase (MazG superfamily)